MKSNEKSKIILLIVVGIFIGFSTLRNDNLNFIAGISDRNTEYSDDITLDNENLKIAAVSGKIHIVGNSGWIAFKSAGNCTGQGTYSDPYVIEDLEIDGGGSGDGILIEFSDVFFRIENCTVDNANNGIRLIFVYNGALVENNCSNNNYGIYLWYSNNNTLIDNNVWNNLYNGIWIRYSDDNNLSGNKAWDSIMYSGIVTEGSDNNNLSKNEAWNNAGGGIWLSPGSDDNSLFENKVWDNGAGIGIESSSNNNISGNNAWGNGPGIRVVGASYDNTLTGNDVWENQWGILLEAPSYNSTVSKNNAWNNSEIGILVYYSNDNTLTENNASDNQWLGIDVDHSNYNFISDNNVSNTVETGFVLHYSHHNIISGNYVWNSTVTGFWANCSNDNTYIGNKAWKNDWGYILHYSDNNNLTENDAWNNYFDGILLWIENDNNILAENSVWSNNRTGIVLDNADNNIITDNEAWNNSKSGFYVGNNSRSNNLLGNNAWNNNEKGFYLNDSYDNFLSGNSAWNNFHGILLNSSINETLINNNISINNTIGIYLCNSTQNLLSLNNVSSNHEYGIYIDENSTDNKIWLNFLDDNIIAQASDNGTGNMWDNGFAGNYWGDYIMRYPGASDIGGIWDIPYDIPGDTSSTDRYPLVLPFFEDFIPTAHFTVNTTQIKFGEWVQFNDASIGGNDPLSYQWNFGDGTPNSTEINPKHQYTLPGSYNIILTVTDLDGDISIIVKNSYITVIDLIPVADFTANATLISLSNNIVQFQFTGSEGDGPATFQWNFGDGTVNSTERNPTHQYTLSGSYTVILTIMDADGDTDVMIKIEYIIVQQESTTNGGAIPGYNLFFLIGVICVLSVIIYKKIKKS